MNDTSMWKEFQINKLFTIKSPASRKMQAYDIGTIPYVSSGVVNNGIVSYLKPKDDEQLEKGDCITVSPLDGTSFYQKCDFLGRGGAGSAISLLYNDNLTEMNALFICTVIKKSAYRFGYSDALTSDNLKHLIIKLPATPDGQPDWGYMESYMKAVMEESEKSLENLKRADATKHLIDVSGWGELSCRDLFECKNTGNILARDVEDGSGTTPFVTASGYNNGVVGYVDASKYDIIKGHCILVGGKTFTITYQKDDFLSNDSHNFTIRVKGYDISDLCYLYLVSVIYTYFGQKYSWNDAVTKDKLMADNIPLPIDVNGEPNWAYMESYMKQIMDRAEQTIEDLKHGH